MDSVYSYVSESLVVNVDLAVSEGRICGSVVSNAFVVLFGLFLLLPQPERIRIQQKAVTDTSRMKIFFIFIIYPFSELAGRSFAA